MAQEFTRDRTPEAEPAFGFLTRPVVAATTARRGQHDLPVEQCDHVPGRDGADDEDGAGPRDQEGGARFDVVIRVVVERVVVVAYEIRGVGAGGCDGCVDGGVITIRDRCRLDLIEDHNGGMGGRIALVETVV